MVHLHNSIGEAGQMIQHTVNDGAWRGCVPITVRIDITSTVSTDETEIAPYERRARRPHHTHWCVDDGIAQCLPQSMSREQSAMLLLRLQHSP